MRLGRQAHVVEHQLGGHRRAQRQLLVDVVAAKPGVSVGHDEAADRRRRRSRAQTTATSAIEPLVIHILVPLSTQSSPSRRAGCAWTPGRCRSPARSGRSSRWPRRPPCAAATRCFCSSEPNRQIGEHRERALHGDEAAQPGVAGLELEAGQAVGRRRWCPRSRSPRGACRAGRARRSPWPSPAAARPARTTRRTSGRSCSRTNARTVSRIMRSSSESSASRPRKSWGFSAGREAVSVAAMGRTLVVCCKAAFSVPAGRC